uniref:Uncharacterized protein n=1 Tax=Arundo donax TaxID=35708 RepID=A0A0A9D199_ARUDO
MITNKWEVCVNDKYRWRVMTSFNSFHFLKKMTSFNLLPIQNFRYIRLLYQNYFHTELSEMQTFFYRINMLPEKVVIHQTWKI